MQYLLNATAIWLISLLLFDLCLRRESYHNYNRFYLLFTFLLGILLPMWQWQAVSSIHPDAAQPALQRIIAAKGGLMASAPVISTTHVWGALQWTAMVYLAGAAIMFFILLADAIKLVLFYRYSSRSKQGKWTIAVTGKEHAPFSFLNILFVSGTQMYDKEEWDMILVHEKRHANLLHFADVLLMQLARIVFWFHPLIYLYNKRLMLVHEYQADNAAVQRPQEYGKFLVEQALLQAPPSLAHSFNRSPIKNRIIMLTRKSSTAARIKMLVFVPLVMACVLCCSKNGFSQTALPYKGVVIPFGHADTTLSEPMSIKEILKNPLLQCKDPNYEVTGFSFSILPNKGDLWGPFTTKSASLNSKAIAAITRMDTCKGRIFIEDVFVKRKGDEQEYVLARALVYRFDH